MLRVHAAGVVALVINKQIVRHGADKSFINESVPGSRAVAFVYFRVAAMP